MLLTVEEASRRLGVRPSTIRRWLFERKIEFVKIGRCVRIRQEVIEDLIKQGIRPALRSPRGSNECDL